jgi:hypothetical protein
MLRINRRPLRIISFNFCRRASMSGGGTKKGGKKWAVKDEVSASAFLRFFDPP